jgi:hypothetical protein
MPTPAPTISALLEIAELPVDAAGAELEVRVAGEVPLEALEVLGEPPEPLALARAFWQMLVAAVSTAVDATMVRTWCSKIGETEVSVRGSHTGLIAGVGA